MPVGRWHVRALHLPSGACHAMLRRLIPNTSRHDASGMARSTPYVTSSQRSISRYVTSSQTEHLALRHFLPNGARGVASLYPQQKVSYYVTHSPTMEHAIPTVPLTCAARAAYRVSWFHCTYSVLHIPSLFLFFFLFFSIAETVVMFMKYQLITVWCIFVYSKSKWVGLQKRAIYCLQVWDVL